MAERASPASKDPKDLAKKGESKPAAKAEGDEKKRGWLAWFVGWVIMPATVFGLIFGSGMLLGAHMPESWYTRAVVWVVGLFA